MYRRTRFTNLIVDIKVDGTKTGKLRITGVAINPEDESKYVAIPPYSAKPVTVKRREAAVAEVVSHLEHYYYNMYGNGVADETAMRKAFSAVKKSVEAGLKLKPNWKAPSTNKNAINFFARNVLPLLLPYASGETLFLPQDQRGIQDAVYHSCVRHMGGDDDTASQSDRAMEAARRHLQEADIILSHMREVDSRLPEIVLSTADFGKLARREEQIKMLDIDALHRFYKALFDRIDSDPRKVFYAVFAVFGLRPAEAAARKPDEIIWRDSYCIVHVTSQEKNGKIVGRLKNKYSRRIVVISLWGMTMLKMCCARIGVVDTADDEPMNLAADCSEWIKDLLVECGVSESSMRQCVKEASDDDLDEDCVETDKNFVDAQKRREQKLASYVLRRCFATIARNFQGLTLYETDRLLGHIPTTKSESFDMNLPQTQADIARKMERYIYDERFTLNPAVTPYKMRKGRQNLIEFSEYNVRNDSKSKKVFSINIEAAETGEAIDLILPDGTEQKLNIISTPKNWKDTARCIIGDTSIWKK